MHWRRAKSVNIRYIFNKCEHIINTILCVQSISGMTFRAFRGFSSIHEVKCGGDSLNTDVKLLSLQLFRVNPESKVLASLNVVANSCMTFSEYSSCKIDTQDTHSSRLRILVHDLKEGETREYGCTANTLASLGNSVYEDWEITVERWICESTNFILFHEVTFNEQCAYTCICVRVFLWACVFMCTYLHIW